MLNLITGTPGAGKTLYAVSLIVEFEKENTRNLLLNPVIYKKNLELIQDNNLLPEFEYCLDLKNNVVLLDPHYFDCLGLAEREETYYQRTLFYNDILKRIRESNSQINLKDIKPVRTIYADINGLNVEHVRDSPDDWRTCPDGSIVFYDEIQLRDTYKDQRTTNEIVSHLQIHRHRGFDIYGITQFPVLIHQHFRAVVGQHFHLHRGWGLGSATVYLWAFCVLSPNEKSKKLTAERDFRFTYKKENFKYYKSATVHTHKTRIPKKFYAILLLIIVGLYIAFHSLFASNNFLTKIAEGHPDPAKPKTTLLTPNPLAPNSPAPPVQPEIAPTLTYDPNKPFETDYSKIPRQATSYPNFSGCIKTVKSCNCYTQQGTILKVDVQDCKRVISGEMPFNPYKQEPLTTYSQTPFSSFDTQTPQPVQTIKTPVKIASSYEAQQVEKNKIKDQDWTNLVAPK